MMRRSFRFLIFLFGILILSAANSAYAASLNELREQFTEYQKAPLERVAELREKVEDLRKMEEGIARQFDIPTTQVLIFENQMEELMNFYQVLHYQQKHIAKNNFFTADDMRLHELIETKPPYSYLFYISFIEELQNHRDELAEIRARRDELRQILVENADDKLEAERAFRLYNEKLSGNPPNRLTVAWKLMEAEVMLEQVTVRQTGYSTEIRICDARIETLEQKLSLMEPMIASIRSNMNFENYDFIYLDTRVYNKTDELEKKLDLLDKQFDYLESLQNASTRPSDVVKYIVGLESGFLHQEVELVLNMIESWYSMRMVWRAFVDLIEGNIDMQGEQDLLANTQMYTDFAQTYTKTCNTILQRTRELEAETKRRFDNPLLLTENDIALLARFHEDLEARRTRYLAYIMDLGTIDSRFHDLQEEIKSILQSTDAEIKWTTKWRHALGGFMNRELWYFDDYPITVRKILDALFLFFIGLLITHYMTYLIGKRLVKKASLTEHNRLLIVKVFYYLGIVFSFIIALWSLHIPMTAFAFFGGALAIALGFGTQRIMGDMFSGIILLFQKKLRIGDAVVIDDELGVVKEITLQNTVIRSKETLDHIIPNSKILDSHIINLTLSTTIMRVEIDVTIDASASIGEATNILNDILKEEGKVLTRPPHKILFSAFADNGNTLTAIFFVDMAGTRRREVASRLRCRILEEFTKAGIGIPCPQTEVTIKKASDIAQDF